MKILIVDDEEIQRRKLARLISESSISFSDILSIKSFIAFYLLVPVLQIS